MYERIERIKKRVVVDHYPICIEKYRITADVLEHSKHDPAVVQRGKMLKAYAERMPIAIADDELIVGLGASKPMGLEIDPNYGIWTQDEIDSLVEDGYIMSEQDQKDLQELNKYHDPATQIGMQGDIFYEPESERILKLLKAGLVLPPWKEKSDWAWGPVWSSCWWTTPRSSTTAPTPSSPRPVSARRPSASPTAKTSTSSAPMRP